jgi:hypothetical protein
MVIGGALVIGGLLGAALGRVIGQRTGAVVGAAIGTAACLAYTYLLNAGVLIPERHCQFSAAARVRPVMPPCFVRRAPFAITSHLQLIAVRGCAACARIRSDCSSRPRVCSESRPNDLRRVAPALPVSSCGGRNDQCVFFPLVCRPVHRAW